MASKPPIIFRKHNFQMDYANAVKYEDKRLAEDLILSELKNTIKSHRQEIITLLKNYKYKVSNPSTSQLTNMIIEGLKNKDFKESIANLMNKGSVNFDNLSYSVDGDGNKVEDLKKSEDKWFYNQQSIESIGVGLDNLAINKNKQEKLQLMMGVTPTTTYLKYFVGFAIVAIAGYYIYTNYYKPTTNE